MRKGLRIIPAHTKVAYQACIAGLVHQKRIKLARQGIILKGFAYPAVLFLLAAALSAAVFFTFAAARWRGIIRLDLQGVQARQMAENALVYIDTHAPVLPANNLSAGALNRDALLTLEGFDYRDENLGFRIVRNKEVIYLIGYAGRLPEPGAVYILYQKGGMFKPW